MTEFDLRALLELLREREIDFIVIGGVAVAAHGFVRGTEDLDLVPDPDPANLQRLAAALEQLADTKFGGLDIIQLAQGVPGYSQLAEDAVDSELLGIPVRVCSLSMLRQMKEAQGRALDKADLENLPEG